MSSLVTTVTVVSLAAVAGVVGTDTSSQGAASPLCFGMHATIPGTDAVVERIDGTPGDDVISGGREGLVEVSRRLGHSSIAVTADIYSHVSTDLAREAAER